MKRDVLLLVLCVCLVVGGSCLGARQVMPASAGAGGQRPTLILDAGHGGEDGGAVSAAGDRESDINLSIVLKLDALMAFLGVDAQTTRDTDISLHSSDCETIREKKVSDLKNRVAMVNDTADAMLISVHQNHFTDPRYDGAQVFYNKGDISRQWGELTQETLRQVLDPDNGRKAKGITGGIYLFEHISCPSILVECGFLSNGEEASLLLTDAYQRKIAVALAGAYFHQQQSMPEHLGGN